MALSTIPSSGPGSAGAGSRDLINATIRALNDLVDRVTNGLAQVAQDRAQGDALEAQQRTDAIAAAIKNLGDQIQVAAAAEGKFRADGDQQNRDIITAEGQFRVQGDQAEARARADAILALVQRLDASDISVGAALDAITAIVTRQRYEFVPVAHRPGESPARFVRVASPNDLGGSLLALPRLPDAMLASGDCGSVCRIQGAAIVATRQAFPLEPNRAYRPRAAFQRRTDPSDPANDAVQWGATFLDQGGNVLPGGVVILDQVDNLRTALGRKDVQTTMARSAGANVLIVTPARARSVRFWFRTYGPDAVTDLELLDDQDVTDATLLDPVSADVVARVAELESVDPGPRLDRVEAAVAAPNSLTLRSKAEAANTAIPETVTVVRLLGRARAGDGFEGLYARGAGGIDTFVSGGVTWSLVPMAPAMVATLLSAAFAYLPDTPPAGPSGQPWRNNGGISFT